ncbi:glycosyltransferase family 2 protein [Corynebacterium sp.]|uniref:glycosyltransferase family 2 protein n=1 Tax=Corynebacterium sp. TaxID=1720 RepID=UPI0026E06113|nr:glycosyltransferase family 2 protein [Corynebacterium sp.]MDO5513132.1 glycosyltransferase family 2 protein [Corynebacterium sp.]
MGTAQRGHARFPIGRAIGVGVVGVAAMVGVMLWLAIGLSHPERPQPEEIELADGWSIMVSFYMPPAAVMVAAVFVAIAVLVEQTVSKRYRISEDADRIPLAPKIVMADTRGVFHGPVTITVLVPAHNEAERITATIRGLLEQDNPPERIIVVADNCTDETPELARAAGVEVFETQDNRHKKAGGLNQALRALLPEFGENDVVMIVDADTVLDQGYLTEARRRFTSDRALMAVGGLFYGEPGAGLLGQFQRNEYTRYSRDIRRRRGKVFVLTGTASAFRPRGLRMVARSRGTLLPGREGDVYDTAALTEDNELTLALKSLGGLMVSPNECSVVTEVMPTWRQLWHQRLRWQRGALENLGAYGVTPQTTRYWFQQLGIGYGVVSLGAYVALIVLTLMAGHQWVWYPFWMALGSFFIVERLVTVWRSTWFARFVAVLLIPELIYAAFLNLVFMRGVVDILLAKQAQWGQQDTAPALDHEDRKE